MRKVRIGDLFELEKGSLQSSKCTKGDFDFITAAKEWKKHNEFSHDREALVFAAMASGSLGRTHYVNGKFITSDLCYILTPKDSEKYPINLKFYHFVFNSLKEEIVKNTKSGTSKEAINQTNLKNHEVPYFDIKQQNSWIEKLLNTKAIKESLILEIQIQQTLLKKLRQSILQEAIEGKLTCEWREQNPDVESASVLLEKIKAEKEQLIKEKKIKKQKPLPPIKEEEIPFEIPDGWEWCRLGDTGIFERGKSKHRPRNDFILFNDGIYPFIQTGDVAQSKYYNYKISTFNKKYNELGLAQSKLWEKGTFCITIAANIAETGFLDIDACFPDSVVGFNSIDINIPKYIQYFFIISKEEIEKYAPATAQKNINLGIINELIFPLAPLNEIIEIVKKIESLFNLCDELEEQINNSKQNSQKLMQAVLKEAFEVKTTLSKDEEAMVAISYIIDSISPEKLGRVKLQKILSMHIIANNVDYGFNLKKYAMGPYDPIRMNELEEKLVYARWFKKEKQEGDKGRIFYTPLDKKSEYREKFEILPYKKELENIVKLMEPWSLSQSEILATLFAVYKKESSLFGNIPDEVIIGKAKEWHPKKEQYFDENWRWGISWLKENGFIKS